MQNFRYLQTAALMALCFSTLVNCQSSMFQRGPSSSSTGKNTKAEQQLSLMNQEILQTLPVGDHPRRMLFDYYRVSLNDLNPKHDSSWVFQKKAMDLIATLNQSLLDDPLTEKMISLVPETFAKMDQIFTENPSYLVPQKMIDEQQELARRRFIYFQTSLMAADLKSPEVAMNKKEKKQILKLVQRIQKDFQGKTSDQPMQQRGLATAGKGFVLTQPERKQLEKISTHSIPVMDSGDVFGGTEALGKSQRIQYGARFLLAVLQKPDSSKAKSGVRR